jgi:hypothetical protein
MNGNKVLFIEDTIIEGVKSLLTSRMNELIADIDCNIPIIEFGNYSGANVIVPKIAFTSCERTEKERLILLDAYSITITFDVPDNPDSVLFTWVYFCAANKVFNDSPTLGGIADRLTLTSEDIKPPKVLNCGQDWQVIVKLRLTVEGTIYARKWL